MVGVPMNETKQFCRLCGGTIESRPPGDHNDVKSLSSVSEAAQGQPIGSYLACLVHSGTSRVYSIDGTLCRIGRHASNEIVLEDAYASMYHALILVKKGHYFVEDLDSTNGTFHNDSPLTQRRPLANGDRLGIGRTHFTFVLKSPIDTFEE